MEAPHDSRQCIEKSIQENIEKGNVNFLSMLYMTEEEIEASIASMETSE